jgi:DNA-binding response OmpR family regulator
MSHPHVVLQGKRAIVAAAEPGLVGFVTLVLYGVDCVVFRAYDALAAYELAIQLNVDFVVTNSAVGQVEGDTLVRALRRRLPDLPVLHISAGEDRDRKVEAGLPEDVPSLEEPFTDEQLVEAVRSILR